MTDEQESNQEKKLVNLALRLEQMLRECKDDDSLALSDLTSDQLTPEELEELQQAGDAMRLLGAMRALAEQGEPVPDISSGSEMAPATAKFSATPSPEEKSRRIGRYTLLQQIGEGGMGTVWMAEQEQPVRRRVALKLIKPGRSDKQIIARFEAERQALAMMEHPNVAKVLDAGTTEDGMPYFVMELVQGDPITEYCDKHELTPRQRLELFVQVCEAIQHAHLKGIIHRDLKPNNILVHELNGKPTAKVIDFGLAKALAHQARLTDKTVFTEFGQVVGTVQYMSPEQAKMDSFDIDARTDVYSLGVILYELLAGSTPIDKDTLAGNAILQVLEMIRDVEPPRPSHRLSSSVDQIDAISKRRKIPASRLRQILRGDLDWIIMKAIEKDRNRRYITPNDFGDDIQRYLNGDSVVARPPSTAYIARKYIRKNLVPVALTTALFLSLVTGTTVSTMKWKEAESATAAALASAKHAETAAKRSNDVLNIVTESFRSVDPNTGTDANMSAKDVLLVAKNKLSESDLDDEGRMQLLARLGETLTALTEYEESVDVREQLLELCITHYGNSHAVTIGAMTDLGNAYRGANRRKDAIQLQEKGLELSRSQFSQNDDDNDVDLIPQLNNLAMSYHDNGETPRAVKLFEEMVELSREANGADHIDTVKSEMQLATLYQEVDRKEEALPLLVTAEEFFRTNFGEDHIHRLAAMNNLSYGKRLAGHPEEALPILEEITQIMRKKFGDEHARTLGCMKNLGVTYVESNQTAKAIPVFEETLALCQAKYGDKHLTTNALKVILASAYESEGRALEALPLLEDALSIRKELSSEDWSLYALQSQYGGVLLKLGKINESSKFLLDGFEGMQRLADTVKPQMLQKHLTRALKRLIELAEVQEAPEQLARWKKQLSEL